ncbi:MAG: hypothetical protein K2J63_10500, partial [Muribaculaceae bacterium]|nr:hypothetical protein [Muribaculaceae bacterium]
MRRNIFIFNPETDYALALGRTHYNPPAKIVALRKQLQLVQAHIATRGDIIVVSDDFSSASYPDKTHLKLVEEKEIQLIKLNQLAECISNSDSLNPEWQDSNIRPWGWNHSLRRRLLDAHIDERLLKTNEQIDTLRQLSHRHTTIPFQLHLQKSLSHMEIPVAKEFFTVEEAMDYAISQGTVFFKAPWSSSGRGIIRYDTFITDPNETTTHFIEQNSRKNISGGLAEQKLGEWLGGFIRKQGSVMGERAFDRIADFATEWMIDSDKVDFLGLSLFNTSAEGRYLGNRNISQTDIDCTLKRLSPSWTSDV